ncbi:MAG TPA: hypothetical protein VM076_20800 [Gemmatimonadaceae bacterium]|nr:hypothetical protein [Gemmatimonadaceae bacterium]
MPSRAERVRVSAELVLRGVALVALAALLWRALQPPAVEGTRLASDAQLASALGRWTYERPARAHVVLDRAPDPRTRDWLRALASAGTAVQWSSSRPLGATAVVAEPTAEPYGATRVRLAAASGTPVTVGDAAGLIDTLPRGGASELELRSVAGSVRATGATFVATTTARDSVSLRPVLVLGTAGWESKFTIAALEERGWRVASRVRVAPNVEITQGPLGAIDTSRYAAVVLLDSSAVSAAVGLARYVRDGGGVVLAGTVARSSAAAALAAGGVGRRIAGVAGAVTTSEPRTGLGVFPVVALKRDAVPLESRDDAVTVAARRVAAGRVIQLGYDETWRWRMAGGDEAAAAHREWWSRLVSSVAYAPLVRRASAGDVALDEAPLASLMDALGPSTPIGASATPDGDDRRSTRILFALAVGGLLLEWASRRLRGAR